MARKTVQCLAAAGLLVVLAAVICRGQPQGQPPTRVEPARVRGIVYYSDGRTPAEDVPVRVWDADRQEFIYETKTDERGLYKIPNLPPGRYYVTFNWTKVDLQVAQELAGPLAHQPHDIIVCIPRPAGFAPLNALLPLLTTPLLTDWERPPVVSP